MANILASIGKGAVDKANELIDDRTKRREALVGELSVKYFDTVQKAKARRTTEKTQVTKAVQYAKQNGVPQAILEQAIMESKSPDEILSTVINKGSKWLRAKNEPALRTLFGGDASQFDADQSGAYADPEALGNGLMSSAPGVGEVGATAGFGSSVADQASNQAFQNVGDLAGMSPEEVAGYIRNTPTAGNAGMGVTAGMGTKDADEVKISAASGEGHKLTELTTIAKEIPKRLADDMNIESRFGPDGSFVIMEKDAQRRKMYSDRVVAAMRTFYSNNGYSDIGETFAQSISQGIENGSIPPISPGPVQPAKADVPYEKQVSDYIARWMKKNQGKKIPPEVLAQIEEGVKLQMKNAAQ
jgi:hypothetical protein